MPIIQQRTALSEKLSNIYERKAAAVCTHRRFQPCQKLAMYIA